MEQSGLEEVREAEQINLGDLPDYAALAQMVGMEPDSESSGVSLLDGSSGGTNSQSQSVVSALSIQSLVRAEAALQKSLPVVRGGTHVEFTADDIKRIRDPEVLQFLEENSKMFTKYIKTDAEGKEQAQTQTKHSGVSAAQVEATILEFQREIDTFITTVDHQGKSYSIQVDDHGSLQVPIDDLSLMEEEEEEGEEVEAVRMEEAHSEGRERAGSAAPFDTRTPTRRTDSLDSAQSVGVQQEVQQESRCATSSSSRNKEPASPEPRNKSFMPKIEQKKRLARSNQKAMPSSSRKPPAAVRPVHCFLPEEDARIEELLKCDIATSPLNANPFNVGETARSRLNDIDTALEKLRDARGPLTAFRRNDYALPELRATTREVQVEAPKTANALGNKYMEDMKERQRLEKALARLNMLILKNQRDRESIPQPQDVDDAPRDIMALRPEWAQQSAPLASEEEISALLESAREEELKAAQIVKTSGTGVGNAEIYDPYAPLIQQAREAMTRAHKLTSDISSAPLELTPFRPEDVEVTDCDELGEVPENIREDLFDLI